MGSVYQQLKRRRKPYWDKKRFRSIEDALSSLNGTNTLYVGDISNDTTANQIHSVFSLVGRVQRVRIGINQASREGCGFCFVEFPGFGPVDKAMNHVNGIQIEGKPIRSEKDPGFVEGREYGRRLRKSRI